MMKFYFFGVFLCIIAAYYAYQEFKKDVYGIHALSLIALGGFFAFPILNVLAAFTVLYLIFEKKMDWHVEPDKVHVCSQKKSNWIPDIGIESGSTGEQQYHCKVCGKTEYRGGWLSSWKHQ